MIMERMNTHVSIDERLNKETGSYSITVCSREPKSRQTSYFDEQTRLEHKSCAHLTFFTIQKGQLKSSSSLSELSKNMVWSVTSWESHKPTIQLTGGSASNLCNITGTAASLDCPYSQFLSLLHP